MTKLNDYLCHYFRKNDSFLLSLEKKNFSFLAVHQLDKPVSGLVIFPKNFTSQRIMYQIIKDKKKIIKKYLAICQKLTNYLPFSSKCITGYITKKEEEQKMEFSFHKVNSASKTCSLKIEVKKKEEEKVLLEITLYSGRKHQIRTILSFLKLPILGDVKYGSNFLVKQNKKIDLYAYKLCFIDIPHPLDYLNGKKIVCKHCLDSVTIGGKRNKK